MFDSRRISVRLPWRHDNSTLTWHDPPANYYQDQSKTWLVETDKAPSPPSSCKAYILQQSGVTFVLLRRHNLGRYLANTTLVENLH